MFTLSACLCISYVVQNPHSIISWGGIRFTGQLTIQSCVCELLCILAAPFDAHMILGSRCTADTFRWRMELLLALRKGHPELAAFVAEGLSCAAPAAAAFLLALAVCSSRQRSLILVALPSFRTASLMQSACAA